MSQTIFLSEHLADWRNSKRIYLEYHSPANCDGLACEVNPSAEPIADAFNHAHIGIRGEEPDNELHFVFVESIQTNGVPNDMSHRSDAHRFGHDSSDPFDAIADCEFGHLLLNSGIKSSSIVWLLLPG